MFLSYRGEDEKPEIPKTGTKVLLLMRSACSYDDDSLVIGLVLPDVVL